MTEEDFKQCSEFIHAELGIKLPPAKKTMLEARLQKRLRVLGLATYGEYCDYLFTSEGMAGELGSLINAVTTNTTDFFREPKHFDFLSGHVLPEWMAANGPHRRLRLWSAGCSVGMEPYTLAMVLNEFKAVSAGFTFSILATDISSQALEKAVAGIYEEDRVAPVPDALKRKYLLRSKDRTRRLVRIAPEVRKQIAFKRLNFMDAFSFREPMDIIFCRNVIIYFDRPTQEVLFQKFCQHLRPGGYIFIGHSESLAGMDLPLRQTAPTVYRKGS
ncbi:MAG: protein-glutamate O-methyltransferase CheR [Desulfovibrionaceae bacterium]